MFNATQIDSDDDDNQRWLFSDNCRALQRNFRNTADVSDTLQSILGILKEYSEDEYDPQERGHFIHGPRVTIDVITFHKKKEFDYQILEAIGKPITFSTWLEKLVEQEEEKNKIKGIRTRWISANLTDTFFRDLLKRYNFSPTWDIASTEFSSVAIVFGLRDKARIVFGLRDKGPIPWERQKLPDEMFIEVLRELYTAVSRATVYCRVFIICPDLLDERDDLVESEQPDSNSTSSSYFSWNILQTILLEFDRNVWSHVSEGQDNLELRDRLRGPRIRRHKFQVQKKYEKVQVITTLPHQQVIEYALRSPHLAQKSPNEPTQEDFVNLKKNFPRRESYQHI